MKAAAIVGSQCFGLNNKNSDIDIKIITKEKQSPEKIETILNTINKADIHAVDQLTFMSHFFGRHSYLIGLTSLTSLPLMDDVPIFTFLRENREEYIVSNKQNVYLSYLDKISVSSTKQHYKLSPKTLATNIRLLQVLLDYKETGNWGESFKAPKHLKSFLLDTKQGKRDFEEVNQKRLELQELVEKDKEFFIEPINKEYNDWFYHQCCEILEIPYPDLEKKIEAIPQKKRI